jgi:predicted RNA binding protein YcfA (HicA-like mRNA interferase family)
MSGPDLIVAIRKAGFQVVRICGSHHFLRDPDGRSTVVAVHGAEIIGPGLLSRILREFALTLDDLRNLL